MLHLGVVTEPGFGPSGPLGHCNPHLLPPAGTEEPFCGLVRARLRITHGPAGASYAFISPVFLPTDGTRTSEAFGGTTRALGASDRLYSELPGFSGTGPGSPVAPCQDKAKHNFHKPDVLQQSEESAV